MPGHSARENRETLLVSAKQHATDRSAKAHSRTADMHAGRESDGCIVPTNDPNKDGRCASAEDREGRRPTKENASTWPPSRTQCRTWASRVACYTYGGAAVLRRRHSSAVRAVCGNAARTDPCGGRRQPVSLPRPPTQFSADSTAFRPRKKRGPIDDNVSATKRMTNAHGRFSIH